MKTRVFVLLAIVLLVVTACAAPATPVPTAAPTTAAPAAAATKPAATPAPTTAAPAPTATAGPKRGGKVVMGMWQSPVTLNYYLGTQTVVNEVANFVTDGLTRVLPNGIREPNLAREMPTQQNGGISADGKTITWRLKEGILFSDGAPLTCDDVKYTWQAIMTPGVGVVTTIGYNEIETIECPNPTTVVMKFKNFYAPYLSLGCRKK